MGKAVQDMLGDAKFLSKIQSFDRKQVQSATLAELEPYIRDLKPSCVRQSSAAASGLCQWILDVCGQQDYETTSTASTCSETQSWILASPSNSACSESELTRTDDIKLVQPQFAAERPWRP